MPTCLLRRRSRATRGKAQADDRHSRPQHGSDGGQSSLRRHNPQWWHMPRASGARQDALPHARRRPAMRRAERKWECAKARTVHAKSDGRTGRGKIVARRRAEAPAGVGMTCSELPPLLRQLCVDNLPSIVKYFTRSPSPTSLACTGRGYAWLADQNEPGGDAKRTA